MYVCVAVRALQSDIRKNGFEMAIRAIKTGMQSFQGIACVFLMVKVWERTDWLPARRGVATLAFHLKRAMGVFRPALILRIRHRRAVTHRRGPRNP